MLENVVLGPVAALDPLSQCRSTKLGMVGQELRSGDCPGPSQGWSPATVCCQGFAKDEPQKKISF